MRAVIDLPAQAFSAGDLATLIELLARFIANGPAGEVECGAVAPASSAAASTPAGDNE